MANPSSVRLLEENKPMLYNYNYSINGPAQTNMIGYAIPVDSVSTLNKQFCSPGEI